MIALNLFLLLSLCWGVLSSIELQNIDGKEFIKIPINLQNPDGSEKPVFFMFDPTEEKLEFRAADFCEQNNIRSFFCRKLFELAYEQERQYRRSKYFESTLYPDLQKTPVIPNSHLLRNPKAIQAELLHATSKQLYIQEMKNRESAAWNEISKVVFSERLTHHRLAVIHSCLFPNQTTRVLENLLTKIETTGLQKNLDQLFVFHYGVPLKLPGHLLASKVHLVHVSNDSSLFEIPTLRMMHRLASVLPEEAQLLYLHTKGVSYATPYAQIDDWVGLMLHFLVEKHSMCYHLLASGEFDAVGVNYCTHPRMFSGNFFWSTAQYLQTLAPLSLDTSNKYDAEYWLFRAQKIRVYVAHVSNVFHASHRYPRFCYASVAAAETPDFQTWSQQCQEDNVLEYEYLHGQRKRRIESSSSQSSGNIEVMESEQMASEKISTGRCTALELYRSE